MDLSGPWVTDKAPGPYCHAAGITTSLLLDVEKSENIQTIIYPTEILRNGLVLELCKLANQHKITLKKVANWLQLLYPSCLCYSTNTLESRIIRTRNVEKNFTKKKKNRTFKSLKEYEEAPFLTNKTSESNPPISIDEFKTVSSPRKKETVLQPDQVNNSSATSTEKQTCVKSPPSQKKETVPPPDQVNIRSATSTEKKTCVKSPSSQKKETAPPPDQVNIGSATSTEKQTCVKSPPSQKKETVPPPDQVNIRSATSTEKQTCVKSPSSQKKETAPPPDQVNIGSATSTEKQTCVKSPQSKKKETVPPPDQVNIRSATSTEKQTCVKSPPSKKKETIPPPDQVNIRSATSSEKQTCEKSPPSKKKETVPPPDQVNIRNCATTTVIDVTPPTTNIPIKTLTDSISVKDTNLIKNEISQLQKKLTALQKLIETEKDNLESVKKINGHFSVRNVTKRDETARTIRKSLNSMKSAFVQQQRLLTVLQDENHELNNKLSESEAQKVSLESNVQRLRDVDQKKTKAQKLASYFKNTMKRMQDNQETEHLKYELKKKQDEIEILVNENETLKDKLNESKCVTRNSDGSFSNNVRLCVMELFALEIGMEKIPCAIETVSKHMFSHTFEKTALPTTTTVRHIVDEGHYLAKSYIAYKIEKAESIGISRDGTTRKKEKVLDTTITLDTGETISLGFTKVARETADHINDVTKMQLNELGETVVTTEFVGNSLEKLSFTMSDRASNEKRADKLLNEWRDSVLQTCGNDNEKQTVFQFHCMAHVLLGFHRYVTEDMKKFEKEIVATQGPIGRDNLPMFKFWSKKQTIAERITYTSSGVFGPVGDHLGLRDRWEAYCATNGVKSLIGNYKDNRFNSLFQTAAEVFVHRENFLEVIGTVKAPNMKILSVQADLQSEFVCLVLRALTMIYVKVTGPYWCLVTSGAVSYLNLYPYVQGLHKYLSECATKPSILFGESSWMNSDMITVPHLERFKLKLQDEPPFPNNDELKSVLSLMCKSLLRTIEKQLSDFLTNGKYSTKPSKADEARTNYSQVTNLSCEHHFGDLDSSQKRRPNASFHHHSSVQLLKRNRRKLINWVIEMPDKDKSSLMHRARRGGIELRKRHREHELNVQSEILENMENDKKKKKSKDVRDCQSDEEFESEELLVLPNMDGGFNINEYVVVAYQDTWYPGCVTKCIDDKTAVINFMVPCRTKGTFKWPAREDTQTVDKEFVIMRGLLPECCNSGRQWFFNEHKNIEELYQAYHQRFF